MDSKNLLCVYSKELEVGLCKYCILFVDDNFLKRGNSMKIVFHNIDKPGKNQGALFNEISLKNT